MLRIVLRQLLRSGRGEEELTPDPFPKGRGEEGPTREEATPGRQRLRARPVLIVLLLLLSLALISGAAYALSRSLGYLPGVGLIEQGLPLRVLAEPLSQTRDGITVTVSEAILTGERTVIVMTMENVPWKAFAHGAESSVCYAEPQLRLPNGELLRITAGSLRKLKATSPSLAFAWFWIKVPAKGALAMGDRDKERQTVLKEAPTARQVGALLPCLVVF